MFDKFHLAKIQVVRASIDAQIDSGRAMIGDVAASDAILNLLNSALATTTICALRYQRYQQFAGSSCVGQFMARAAEAQRHVDLIATRIVALGGVPACLPEGVVAIGIGTGERFVDLVKADIVADCITGDGYKLIMAFVEYRDPTTYRMLADILASEKSFARALAELLESLPA